MAERPGFEPGVPKGYTRFPTEPIRPLWHLSARPVRRRPAGGPGRGDQDCLASISLPEAAVNPPGTTAANSPCTACVQDHAKASQPASDGRETAIGLIIRLFLLAALVKLLLRIDKPWVCAVIYVGLGVILRLLIGVDLVPLLIVTALAFALAWLYFWLLYRTQESIWFWIILVGGLAIGLV